MNLLFNELRTANLQRCEQTFHSIEDWSPTDWATAFAGEAGEACNYVKKLGRLQNPETIKKRTFENTDEAYLVHEIGKELADTVIYADLLATRLGLNLGEYVKLKFNEVSDRHKSETRL